MLINALYSADATILLVYMSYEKTHSKVGYFRQSVEILWLPKWPNGQKNQNPVVPKAS